MGDGVVVLGGGGTTGFAWEIGILTGLAEAGVHLADADVIVGTSAGSMAGVALTAGLEQRYTRELEPTSEAALQIPLGFGLRWGLATLLYRDPERLHRKLGAMALAARTGTEADRRSEVIDRLGGVLDWPAGLHITAVDAESGALTVFGATSGADLVDAVAASTALPGIRPPATINGRRYIDGGISSTTNADIVAGHEKVVVIAPISLGTVDGELITPDQHSRQAMGRSLKEMGDPARRAASARAGHAQATKIAAHIASFWS